MENQKKVIDLTTMLKHIVSHKKVFLIVLPLAFVLSSAYILTIPRYYSCDVMLAPEASDNSGGLTSLMSSFGFGNGNITTEDAITPRLYPDLMQSREFVYSLFDVKITTSDGSLTTDYYTYLTKYQEKSIWTKGLEFVINLFKSNKNESVPDFAKQNTSSESFWLTKKESDIADLMNSKISYVYDKKTSVISVAVKDQDKYVCATLADTITARLQRFITDYRTKKARQDLAFSTKVWNEAKENYEIAAERFASATDANWDLVDEGAKVRLKTLDQDQDMKYQTYQAITQKLQAARMKVQEATPVFTMIKKPTVPSKPAGPKRMIFVAFIMMLATFGTIGYSVYDGEKKVSE